MAEHESFDGFNPSFSGEQPNICPRCQSPDVIFEHVTLQFGVHLMLTGAMDKLGIEKQTHENFPILRCQNCNNVALSEDALIKIIPALESQEFDLVQAPPAISRSHELN